MSYNSFKGIMLSIYEQAYPEIDSTKINFVLTMDEMIESIDNLNMMLESNILDKYIVKYAKSDTSNVHHMLQVVSIMNN